MADLEQAALAGPREAFERFRDRMLANDIDGIGPLLADDGVVEAPFAQPGTPSRFEGRAAFATFSAPRQAEFAERVRLSGVRDVVVHETTDPEVAIVEYTVEGVRRADGMRAAAPFVLVVRVRDGQVVLWREYQNPAAMAMIAAG